MIQLDDPLLYAAFQEVDTRLQNLCEGDFETEVRALPIYDRQDFIKHCNQLVQSYNRMLAYFIEHPLYHMHVKQMGYVARVFAWS